MLKIVSLFSGSSGNCIFLSDGTTRILVDAGLSGKRIEGALESVGETMSHMSAILITHEHSDHIQGAGILARRHKVPVYANAGTWYAMKRDLGKLLPEQVCYFNTGEAFSLGAFTVRPFAIPHDAAEPVGYNFFIGTRKITIATDIGHIQDTLLPQLEQSDLILLESNHDVEMLKVGRYPWPLKQRILGDHGHLCNERAGEVVAHLAEQGTRYFILGHLSQENNFPELAYQTTCNALQAKAYEPGRDVYLEVAYRDRASKTVLLDETVERTREIAEFTVQASPGGEDAQLAMEGVDFLFPELPKR